MAQRAGLVFGRQALFLLHLLVGSYLESRHFCVPLVCMLLAISINGRRVWLQPSFCTALRYYEHPVLNGKYLIAFTSNGEVVGNCYNGDPLGAR